MLTYDQAHELFKYKDGRLFWKVQCGRAVVGAEAGWFGKSADGRRQYRMVEVSRKAYPVHRVVFLMHHGYAPPIVDHINRDTGDNRVANLRAATKGENNRNVDRRTDNKSGVRGVDFHTGKWRARVALNGKCVFNKRFDTCEEATRAVIEARRKYHRDFAS